MQSKIEKLKEELDVCKAAWTSMDNEKPSTGDYPEKKRLNAITNREGKVVGTSNFEEEVSDCTKLPRGMPPSSKMDNAPNFEGAEVSMQEAKPVKKTTYGQGERGIKLRGSGRESVWGVKFAPSP
ncbi:hypothetical protein V6N12_030870 [Hibiscus sabdariffa]|uniref:Uncharacterized protein n=1 Tax=Hibiscus sabdariffa TaxID=183260 RepID=A0ABR2EAU1_9ROSI